MAGNPPIGSRQSVTIGGTLQEQEVRYTEVNGRPTIGWEIVEPTDKFIVSIKVYGLQRCATNLATLLMKQNFNVRGLSEYESGWKHGSFTGGKWSTDARFILCVRHPLSHLVRFYAYCNERFGIDTTLDPHFRPGMSFAEFLSSPCYEFDSPAHRWSAMYAHWLEALPADRTAIVRQEDSLADQSWVIGMIGRRLGIVSLGEPVMESRRVDVNGIVRDEPAKEANLSAFTPELLAGVKAAIDPALLAYFGYSIV